MYKIGFRVFQIGEILINEVFLNNLILLLDKGSKFIPCTHFSSFQIFNFLLKNFDQNFNSFNSKIHLFKKNFGKKLEYAIDIDSSHFITCFSEKCKALKKNFDKIKFNVSKESIDFKFNYYKALCNISTENINAKVNISDSEFKSINFFKKQTSFVIIECDKNIGSCLINKELYIKYADDQLNNTLVY